MLWVKPWKGSLKFKRQLLLCIYTKQQIITSVYYNSSLLPIYVLKQNHQRPVESQYFFSGNALEDCFKIKRLLAQGLHLLTNLFLFVNLF